MSQRILGIPAVALLLLAMTALPAFAQPGKSYFNVEVDVTCACDYQVTAWGWGKPNAIIAIDYSFTVTSNGVDYPVTDHLETVADEYGAFRVQVNNKELPGNC